MRSHVLTADSSRQPRPRWLIKRSRAAGILLIGWLFFWVGGIVQPCCMAFAGNLGDDNATSQTMSMAGADPIGPGDIPDHGNDECPQTVAAGTPLLGEVFPLPATTDHIPYLVVASYFAPLLAAAEISSSSDPNYPPPRSRIYLRTQRFLI
jgi:hypothetical protein